MKVGERRLLPPIRMRQIDRKPRLGDTIVEVGGIAERVRYALAMLRSGFSFNYGFSSSFEYPNGLLRA